ncbi:GGDEF domain-containing protein [Alkalihalobacillus sp. LMS39]|uniref:GGDEF domain-containing protein n=1 Tax=Alkalihalobacillus sp. LMS39 TaxID=2924032 RepID=UPI001FB41AE3|nr:GGDEF domain-containing protein [Alkalihalobacillus sp. LMS39]UOE92082.1 GGDEF domain-containing protein [Alkalihalobacillus sp. LMS39]
MKTVQKVYILSLFVIGIVIAISTFRIFPFELHIILLLFLYAMFMFLYNRLTIIIRMHDQTSMISTANYGFSFSVFAGPFGLFLLETLNELGTVLYRKYKKMSEPHTWWAFLYNISTSVIYNSGALFVFLTFVPDSLDPLSIWYFLFMFCLMYVSGLVSTSFIVILFVLGGQIRTRDELIGVIKAGNWSSRLMAAISNILFIHFIFVQDWIMVIFIFLLNFLINNSYNMNIQNIKNKVERDIFEQKAYHDQLTLAYNRNFLEKEIQHLNENRQNIGVVITDIDHFKKINDSYNHSVGDQVIKHYVEFLSSYLTEADVLCRTGGEEFTIFLKHRSDMTCLELLETIREDLNMTRAVVEYEEQTVEIEYSASFGMYYLSYKDETPVEKACVLADNLLIHSKQQGRNRVSV